MDLTPEPGDPIERLTQKLKQAAYLERMAYRHATEKDAEIAEAAARLAQREADVARLDAVIARGAVALQEAEDRAYRAGREDAARDIEARTKPRVIDIPGVDLSPPSLAAQAVRISYLMAADIARGSSNQPRTPQQGEAQNTEEER